MVSLCAKERFVRKVVKKLDVKFSIQVSRKTSPVTFDFRIMSDLLRILLDLLLHFRLYKFITPDSGFEFSAKIRILKRIKIQ
ncbi:Pescadillo [Saccharomyces cerevisiae]|nr:Pescadillo [Saccharomyces cerevisiae]